MFNITVEDAATSESISYQAEVSFASRDHCPVVFLDFFTKGIAWNHPAFEPALVRYCEIERREAEEFPFGRPEGASYEARRAAGWICREDFDVSNHCPCFECKNGLECIIPF